MKRADFDPAQAAQTELDGLLAQHDGHFVDALVARISLKQLLFDLDEQSAVSLTEIQDTAVMSGGDNAATDIFLYQMYYSQLFAHLEHPRGNRNLSFLGQTERGIREALQHQSWDDAEIYYATLLTIVYRLRLESQANELSALRIAAFRRLIEWGNQPLPEEVKTEIYQLLYLFYSYLLQYTKPL